MSKVTGIYLVRLQDCVNWLLASSCLSVCLSIHLHGITHLPLDGLLWNLIFEDFLKICWEYSSFINIWKKDLWYCLAEFFLEWEIFQKKVAEKIKTYILCSLTLFPKIVPFIRYSGKTWYSQTGHRWQYNMIQKDGLNFVSLYFKIRISDEYGVNYIWLYSQWSLQMFSVPPSGRTGNIQMVAEFFPHPKKNVLRHWVHRSCDTVF